MRIVFILQLILHWHFFLSLGPCATPPTAQPGKDLLKLQSLTSGEQNLALLLLLFPGFQRKSDVLPADPEDQTDEKSARESKGRPAARNA